MSKENRKQLQERIAALAAVERNTEERDEFASLNIAYRRDLLNTPDWTDEELIERCKFISCISIALAESPICMLVDISALVNELAALEEEMETRKIDPEEHINTEMLELTRININRIMEKIYDFVEEDNAEGSFPQYDMDSMQS